MLEPQSRTLLIDALKPPPDYRLDFAIGTTFTLDLVALLAAPLAFALLDRSGPDGKLSGDPLALLEALRRNADRFAIFCQAGRIAVPRPDRLLLSYLERNVVQVTAPRGGVFHPKVWVLRFVIDDGPVVYRLICSSRNLTFDRSWDTVLVLDGELVDRKNAIAANHPLGDFVAALPGLTQTTIAPALAERLDQFQGELRKVQFELPEGFDSYGFCPLGIDRYNKPPFSRERIDRLLVISPFVCADGLRALSEATDGDIHLVSRLEELTGLDPAAMADLQEISVFSDEQTDPDSAAESEDVEEGGEVIEAAAEPELSGLHAKLYVADQGWNAVVWTGSANATAAAYHRNVEFLVELAGRKKDIGIDALLASSQGQTGLSSFLKPFIHGDQPAAGDADQLALEQSLDKLRLSIAVSGLKLVAAEDAQTGTWKMALQGADAPPPEGAMDAELRAWPITCRAEAMGKQLSCEQSTWAVFESLSFEALTSFVAFEIAMTSGSMSGQVQFVLNLPVQGFPEDRSRRLLIKLLENQEAVMRYIQLLLDAGAQDSGAELGAAPLLGEGGSTGARESGGAALLEPLVRALHRDPARLDDVCRLVEDLKKAGAGERQLPPGFDDIWQPIWEARKRQIDENPAT